MHTQVLIHPKRVERGGVESGEEHVHHYEQINLAVLHAQRHVFIIVLEFLCRCVVACAEHCVVVGYALFQEVAARLVEAVGVFGVFVAAEIFFSLVWGVAVDCGYFQTPVFGQFCHLPHQLVVVELNKRNTCHGKY